MLQVQRPAEQHLQVTISSQFRICRPLLQNSNDLKWSITCLNKNYSHFKLQLTLLKLPLYNPNNLLGLQCFQLKYFRMLQFWRIIFFFCLKGQRGFSQLFQKGQYRARARPEMFKWVKWACIKPGGQGVAYKNCISNCQQKIHHKDSIHNTSKALINIPVPELTKSWNFIN